MKQETLDRIKEKIMTVSGLVFISALFIMVYNLFLYIIFRMDTFIYFTIYGFVVVIISGVVCIPLFMDESWYDSWLRTNDIRYGYSTRYI